MRFEIFWNAKKIKTKKFKKLKLPIRRRVHIPVITLKIIRFWEVLTFAGGGFAYGVLHAFNQKQLQQKI